MELKGLKRKQLLISASELDIAKEGIKKLAGGEVGKRNNIESGTWK